MRRSEKRAPEQKQSFDPCNHEMSNDSSNILQAGSRKLKTAFDRVLEFSLIAFVVGSEGECDTLALNVGNPCRGRTTRFLPWTHLNKELTSSFFLFSRWTDKQQQGWQSHPLSLHPLPSTLHDNVAHIFALLSVLHAAF